MMAIMTEAGQPVSGPDGVAAQQGRDGSPAQVAALDASPGAAPDAAAAAVPGRRVFAAHESAPPDLANIRRVHEGEASAPSDAALVHRVLTGEQNAFAVLYDRYARLVRAICFGATRDFHAAADLTQEVFLRAYRNLARLDDGEQFGLWLTGIARRACSEWRRGRVRDARRIAGLIRRKAGEDARHHGMSDGANYERPWGDGADSAARDDGGAQRRRGDSGAGMHDDGDPPSAPAEANETREQLLRRVAELPENERLATHAFYLMGMNATDAGRVTGLSRSALYRVLAAARQRLRQALRDNGV